MKKSIIAVLIFTLAILLAPPVHATDTENLGIRVLPAPGPVTIDGKIDDWDLSGGIFVCSDVENQHDKYATWFHAMYDAQNLYLLSRFIDDTPLNNPGQTIANYGFAGDSLQFRVMTGAGTPQERASHWTCWQGVDQADLMDVHFGLFGRKSDYSRDLKDAKREGAQQAFLKNADGKGYVQELAIPWKLLTADGQPLQAGQQFTLTVEPNFTVGRQGRWSIKDIFKPGLTPDRVFTFQAYNCWGPATLEAKGHVTPNPERLADGREFPIKLEGGVPVVDWTGLIKTKELTGFKTIKFTMPADGYISLHLQSADGTVVRQLLNCAFYTKGPHEVKWDGLTTFNWHTPGETVPAGAYTWSAIWHKGIGLRLRGWADNAGSAPWDSLPTSNWGGDHGTPAACAADGEHVYLGWNGAEAGKALLACDLNGNVLWNNKRAGIAGADLIAVDNGAVYVQHWKGDLYRLDAKTGSYKEWAGADKSADLFIQSLWGSATNAPESANALDARGGKLYLAFTQTNLIFVLDGQTGQLLKKLAVPAPVDVKARADGQMLVISEGTTVLTLNPATGQTSPFVTGLQNAVSLALDKDGLVYVGLREPANQVLVFDAAGKQLRAIGKPGGRALLGKWTPDGMAFISGLTVDAAGKLWVAEKDDCPKRVSVWDTKTGQFVKEFFGPTSYGALGGAINPRDPNLMVGQGCEWRIDPATGKAACLGVITRDGMSVSRFGTGSNGRLYLAVAPGWIHGSPFVSIFERVGDADYKLRTRFIYEGKKETAKTILWADDNGDSQRQTNEETTVDGHVIFSGWYMGFTPDLTIYSGFSRYPVTGFTACGAPQYDLTKPVPLPNKGETGGMGAARGLGSADGSQVLYNGQYGVNCGWFNAYAVATGKFRWQYPSNFVGVHGSHNACPPETGMIRGAYDIAGTAGLPAPIGNIWVIPTNIGEWHILTGDGYYLTRLFEPDPMKFKWPEAAVPGVSLDSVPCGMGGEDFGGSICLGQDGKLYLQAGKTGFWNVEVTGLETVQAMSGGAVTISAADVQTAQGFRERYLQEVIGSQKLTIAKLTPKLTGTLDRDFTGATIIRYQKQAEAAVRSTATWDGEFLYLGWDVKDATPWVNGATEADQLYLGGDTVDFQLGTDPQANKNRAEAGPGDLRLSIGNLQGKPTAVIYRKVSGTKKPKVFSSGVVKRYAMDYVDVVADAKIEVKINPGKGYVIEAAVPLAALGITPAAGLALRGDFGVTHGDPAGTRTRLRTYWSNQHTGLVDDAVFELQMEPRYWGELQFGN